MWGRFRRVVTVHDLIYARFPEAHAGIRDRGMKVLVPGAARRSDRVIADSQSTREDLIGLLGVPSERIDVVPLGLGTVQRARSASGARRACAVRARRAPRRPEPVGQAPAQEPARADRRARTAPAGESSGARAPRLSDRVRGRAARACTARSISTATCASRHGSRREELEGLWAVARRVRVSLAVRGVRAAGARGDGPGGAGRPARTPPPCPRWPATPRCCSTRTTSGHRRARSAGCWKSPALREQLRARGLARAQQFSWERTARLTLDSYARALGTA